MSKYCSYCKSHTHGTQECLKKNHQNSSNKYCSYCDTKTHNTKECYKKPRKTGEGSQKREIKAIKSEKNQFVILEKSPSTKELEVNLKIGSSTYIAPIDTGAQSSYVKRDICIKENIPLLKVPIFQVICANESRDYGNETATIDCCMSEIDHKFKQVFKTMPKLGSYVILGMDFILDNKLIQPRS